jgi:DNA replication and repair protein RecF
VNLLIGDNGQGKTNILEAISYFKFGRSFRTGRDAELIAFGQQFCRVETTCVYGNGEKEEFSAAIGQDSGKTIKKNGKQILKLSELVGRYPIVLFGPHDLKLVSGAPSERRRFVDMVGSMTDSSYLTLLRDYRRILAQRNAAIKSRAHKREKIAWNIELVAKGCELILQRQKITATIEEHVASHAIGLGGPYEFSLEYNSSILKESRTIADNKDAPGIDELAEVFENKLIQLEDEELRRGTTIAGPHRDDICIKLAGKELKKYGSQGQKRLFAVLAKLSELSHLETELDEPSVLLLDDVFSEFDKEIAGKLQRLLESERQVFVTAPFTPAGDKGYEGHVFNVKAGGLSHN